MLLARELGPTGHGILYLLLAVVAVLDNLVGWWVAACRKRLREFGFPNDEAVGAAFLAVAFVTGVRQAVLFDGWPVVIAVVALGWVVYLTTSRGISTEFHGTVGAVARDAGL